MHIENASFLELCHIFQADITDEEKGAAEHSGTLSGNCALLNNSGSSFFD